MMARDLNNGRVVTQNEKKNIEEQFKTMKMVFNNLVQGCFEEVEQKEIFKEIYINQIKLKEKEHIRETASKIARHNVKYDDLKIKNEQDEKLRKKIFNQESKYQSYLLRFQESCNLKNILDMEQYRLDLMKSKSNFKRMKRKLTLGKKKLIRKLNQKKAMLAELKCTPQNRQLFKAIIENKQEHQQDLEVD